ncbi:iron-containing alcohol dehydrogenase [Desulforamulus ruminis]|uniref:Iron-containing alcohol dehydrogenase n=1 Tax=Desulforamulus ruminis (strain ATCC 23193 / DSM 2154 / NCIMB 8452 / DL) TaxID=696281 RepID=F6DTN0_DESRL|nr:iron-containing alcohol dehydrogenase [Desulforamulus ruminis]AEG61204.1 iron-containing alcohol dehydrogenase [Desulforamulus ruminis DSM 2154]
MRFIQEFRIPEIIFGRGSIEQVGYCAQRVGAEKVFLVTDPGILKAGWIEAALPFLKREGIHFEIWQELTENPKDFEVEQATRAYLDSQCDAIVAIGGGSPIDVAKAVAVMATHPGTIHDYEGVDKITNPLPPMIMVPSTAGSGADITQFAVIVDSQRSVKMTIVSKSLVPDISITDPLILTTKDPQLTANTGMDVLAHAIEAYVSLAANFLTDSYSLTAIRLISSYLGKSVSSKTNLEAKDAMAKASLLAAIAASNALIGAVHALAHQVGGRFNLPHGMANAILLPHVMEYNFPACIERLADIGEALGQSVDGSNLRQRAKGAIEAVRTLAREVDIAENFTRAGCLYSEEAMNLLSANAAKDACLITNPRDAGIKDIREIFSRAFSRSSVKEGEVHGPQAKDNE